MKNFGDDLKKKKEVAFKFQDDNTKREELLKSNRKTEFSVPAETIVTKIASKIVFNNDKFRIKSKLEIQVLKEEILLKLIKMGELLQSENF